MKVRNDKVGCPLNGSMCEFKLKPYNISSTKGSRPKFNVNMLLKREKKRKKQWTYLRTTNEEDAWLSFKPQVMRWFWGFQIMLICCFMVTYLTEY